MVSYHSLAEKLRDYGPADFYTPEEKALINEIMQGLGVAFQEFSLLSYTKKMRIVCLTVEAYLKVV